MLTELLSNPILPPTLAATLADVPPLQTESGFWQRAGALRAKALAKNRKARLGDALVAQAGIDAKVPSSPATATSATSAKPPASISYLIPDWSIRCQVRWVRGAEAGIYSASTKSPRDILILDNISD
jgi:hypothetical protein